MALARPGVEVTQTFRSISPVIEVPTLSACCVGVCRQIVDVLTSSPAGENVPNNDAIVPLHAQFSARPAVGTPAVYAGLDGAKLVLALNSGPNLTIQFAGATLTPRQVVAQVLAAFSAANVSAFTAEASDIAWRVRSIAANEFQSIQVVGSGSVASDPPVLAIFGLGSDRIYSGASFYAQRLTTVTPASFPDPRKNLSLLSIDPASVRAFLSLGGAAPVLSEARRDRSFLRSGLASAAAVTGSVDMTTIPYGASGPLDTKTLIVSVNGVTPPLTVTFAVPASLDAALAQMNAVIGAVASATVDAANHLVLTTNAVGPAVSISIGAGTANTTLGVSGSAAGAPAIAAIDAGSAAAITPLVQAAGHNFLAPATAAAITGTVDISTGVPDGKTLILDDGTGPSTLTFLAASTAASVLSQINGMFGPVGGGLVTASITAARRLVLTNARLGTESIIQVTGGTALSVLGLTAGLVRGSPFPVASGDDVFVGGTFLGTVTQVGPGGNAAQLRLDRLVPVNPNLGLSFYVIAKGLPAPNRPTPELRVGPNGDVVLKNDLVRDALGNPAAVRAQVAIAYKAVRRDVSARAPNAGLLRYSDTTTLTQELGPISPDNPLALGLYFAILNAAGTQVTGLGVDAATAAEPFGTVEAYARAAEFLESQEIYGVAPLTHDVSVGQLFRAHVDAMSAPQAKSERICLLNPSAPLAKLDALVASGTSGNGGSVPNTFDTGVANLSTLLLAAGVTAAGAITVRDGVFLSIGNGSRYAVVQVSGSVVTVKTTGFLAGENDDAYYATAPLPDGLIGRVFAIRVRGAPLVRLDGSPDKDAMAATYQKMAEGIRDRRVWQLVPDRCAATLRGVEQELDGFYLAAAMAAMVGAQSPQQSATNAPIIGFTRVLGSNGFFSEKQLDIIAGGGNTVIVQDAPGIPLTPRMALTTNATSIQTRTDSIQKTLDTVAKVLRRGIRNFIGRFNISQGFLDSLGHVIEGIFDLLKGRDIILGASLNTILQDEHEPDVLVLDVTLKLAYPFNYLRLTLAV